MKAVVAAFNQEKALVGAFSVITNLLMELFQALDPICPGSPGAGTARVTIVTRRVTRCNGDAPRDGDRHNGCYARFGPGIRDIFVADQLKIVLLQYGVSFTINYVCWI